MLAVPRSFRPAALVLLIFPLIYLFYSNALPTRRFGGHEALAAEDDVALVFPNDPVPRRDFASLSTYPAQNINEPTKYAYATFHCTRAADTRGPYFEATQSVIWRLLWSEYRSKYPIIVFVCPFVPEANRRILRGQGAIVKEIELMDDIIPDDQIATKRWIDVLSKLNIWREVEWERIVFLDSDAFPVMNCDDLFELVPVQKCKRDELSAEDKAVVEKGKEGEEMCEYVYAGVPQFTLDNINAGMLVLKPNLDMHAKLLRAARKTGDYNPQDMEQGVLRSKNAFAADGPFPVHRLPRIWNALPEYFIEYKEKDFRPVDGDIRILHAKWWNRVWGEWNNLTELNDRWDLDWMTMCRFFDDEAFVQARKTGIFKSQLERFLEIQAKQNTTNGLG